MANNARIFNGVGMVADFLPLALVEGKLTEVTAADLVRQVKLIRQAVNGRLSIGNGVQASQSGNLDGQTFTYFFQNANTDYDIFHGLARIPIGLIQLSVDQDGAVVRPSNEGSWTDSHALVRCSVAGTTALFILV